MTEAGLPHVIQGEGNDDFLDFRDRCELAGVKVPIIAGIMPVTSTKGMERMADTEMLVKRRGCGAGRATLDIFKKCRKFAATEIRLLKAFAICYCFKLARYFNKNVGCTKNKGIIIRYDIYEPLSYWYATV